MVTGIQHRMVKNGKKSEREEPAGKESGGVMNRQKLEVILTAACSSHAESNHTLEVFETWPLKVSDQPADIKHRSSDGVLFVMKSTVAELIQGSRLGERSSPSVAIISSRLPKVLDEHENWFDALRTIGVKLRQNDELLITAESTTAHRYCLRIAQLFSIRHVVIKTVTAEKFDKTFVRSEVSNENIVYAVTDKVIKADQILAMVADSVYGLSVSRKGNAATALSHRLSNQGTQPERNSCTYILHDDKLTSAKTRCQLIDEGAIDWLLLPSQTTSDVEPNSISNTADEPAHNVKVRSLDEIDENEYLIHWTRARSGPWPEQSETDHLDDLIFGSTRSKHAEIFSLCRILASQRIIAAGDLTRDHTPVVCFSEVPPSELRNRTVYRKHLQRWDFLPYGIAIKRSVLEKIFNCKPVIYGDDETWNQLRDHQRPLFQTAASSDGKTDWRQEQEWRVIGDVDLRKLGRNDAFVFTDKENEPEKLTQLTQLAQISLFDLIVI